MKRLTKNWRVAEQAALALMRQKVAFHFYRDGDWHVIKIMYCVDYSFFESWIREYHPNQFYEEHNAT